MDLHINNYESDVAYDTNDNCNDDININIDNNDNNDNRNDDININIDNNDNNDNINNSIINAREKDAKN